MTYIIETKNPRFEHLARKPVSLFASEYAIEDNVSVYAGGLGVLAGDFLLQARDEGLPLVAVGLCYRQGFEIFTGAAAAARQVFPASDFEKVQTDTGQPLLLTVELGRRRITVQVLRKTFTTAHLFLLDADVEQNSPADRMLTASLYPKDFRTKLLQEIVFGIGAVKLLRSLGISPSVYHLHEGHTGFVALALAVEYLHDHPEVKGFEAALEQVKTQIVATKHTILPHAGLFFSRTDFQGILDVYLTRHGVNFDDFCSIGSWEKEPQIFSMTKFLLHSAIRANAVSKLHARVERELHPASRLFPITNAVYLKRWQAPALQQNIQRLSDEELWKVHTDLRGKLIEFVRATAGAKLDPDALTVVWARRFAAYKRPGLLFGDIARLRGLVSNREHPAQFIIAGQPHISDAEGVALLQDIIKHCADPVLAGRVVWLPGYSLATAKILAAGADIWLNTPERGKEASGTSGMKSAANGGLQLSSSDGWVDEVSWEGRGFLMPETGLPAGLYDMLEKEVIPLFYERGEDSLPRRWIGMMRKSAALIETEYSFDRALNEYFDKLYFPEL